MIRPIGAFRYMIWRRVQVYDMETLSWIAKYEVKDTVKKANEPAEHYTRFLVGSMVLPYTSHLTRGSWLTAYSYAVPLATKLSPHLKMAGETRNSVPYSKPIAQTFLYQIAISPLPKAQLLQLPL